MVCVVLYTCVLRQCSTLFEVLVLLLTVETALRRPQFYREVGVIHHEFFFSFSGVLFTAGFAVQAYGADPYTPFEQFAARRHHPLRVMPCLRVSFGAWRKRALAWAL